MESMTCPRCDAEMTERVLGQATVSQCPDGHGVFLSRADLGTLIESEATGTATPDSTPPRCRGSPRT